MTTIIVLRSLSILAVIVGIIAFIVNQLSIFYSEFGVWGIIGLIVFGFWFISVWDAPRQNRNDNDK